MVQNGDVKEQLQQTVQNEDVKPATGRVAAVQPLYSRGFALKYHLKFQIKVHHHHSFKSLTKVHHHHRSFKSLYQNCIVPIKVFRPTN
jgi:hypothetical protein